MTRCLTLFVVSVFAVSPAWAHFVFVVPTSDGSKAAVVLSEDLDVDTGVDVGTVDAAKLLLRDEAGAETALTIDKGEDAREVQLGKQAIAVHGSCEFGVMQRGDSPAFLLVYYPKTILGNAFNAKANLGENALVEIVPLGKPGDVQFQLLAQGKPVADAELTVILPNGNQEKAKTDAEGKTASFKAIGRYGVWARYFDKASGEHNGKPYEQVRRYPTLVADITDGTEKSAATEAAKPAQLAPLPEATSSFGAVACDGWLYVYGGHIARTHTYHTQAVSGRFHRLNLQDGKAWEELAAGPGMQGMNLAAGGGKIYRVGGMVPRNKPEEEVDNHSTTDAACFDPSTGKWEALPPLPVPRSSHDLAVLDNKLYVIGGWNMSGENGEEWCKEMLVLDLASKDATWQSIAQPFERRALTVAVNGSKLYVFGGFTEAASPSHEVNIYDTTTGTWSTGPELPGKEMNGFAPAACTLGDAVYLSVADGTLYRLDEAKGAWEKITSTTPRIVHRLAPRDSQVLVIGGAAKGDNLNLVEVVDPASANTAD